ncbi:MAG TPA: PadR family transcriptional regulator [Pseudolabrys sp.]|nr:PadR family transcriptional regulator [Pseudolabrys sp.]
MKHRHRGDRDPSSPDRYHRHRHGRHHHHREGRRGGRLFDYGELRLLLLAMIAERPRHGYELIKEIEDRFGGSYTPSPGVIYPTLSWLEDMGYAAIEIETAGRKRYHITEEGKAFLVANKAAADELLSRIGADQAHGRSHVPAPVIRAMENLKVALRLRLRRGPLGAAAAENIAAALDAAAKTAESSE